MGEEDRGAARIPVVIMGRIESDEDEPFDVMCTDLSLTGAYVVSPANLRKGARFKLVLDVDGEPGPVVCAGVVMRGDPSGMGLMFDGDQDDSFGYVQKLCS